MMIYWIAALAPCHNSVIECGGHNENVCRVDIILVVDFRYLDITISENDLKLAPDVTTPEFFRYQVLLLDPVRPSTLSFLTIVGWLIDLGAGWKLLFIYLQSLRIIGVQSAASKARPSSEANTIMRMK